MTIFRRFFTLVFLLLAFAGCTRNEYNISGDYVNGETASSGSTSGNGSSTSDKKGSSTDDSDYTPDDGSSGDSGSGVLTIEQAQAANIGDDITVGGYIVGATTKSMKNAEFYPPFSFETAIILRDTPIGDDEDSVSYTDPNLFPVALKAGDIRNGLNLVDNPDIYNQYVVVYGTCKKYLARQGINTCTYYEFY